MKIFSYNINGIRSGLRKGFAPWLQAELPEIINIQEIRAFQKQVDTSIFEALGYHMVWSSANKVGYSGVATFYKPSPVHIEKGIGNPIFDAEGRLLQIEFTPFVLVNTYMPSGTSGEERQKFKYDWLDCFFEYIQKLLRKGKPIVICGDFNIAHCPIDIHNPIANKNSPGFLPEERAWFSKLLDLGFYDVFRSLYPEQVSYSWWSYRSKARQKNIGWRIDYFLCTEAIYRKVTSMKYQKDVNYSDHCPLSIEISSIK